MSIDQTTVNKLKSYIERVENLEFDKKAISDDINEVYKEAKSDGFDVSVLRAIIADRKVTPEELQEFQAIYDTYKAALE